MATGANYPPFPGGCQLLTGGICAYNTRALSFRPSARPAVRFRFRSSSRAGRFGSSAVRDPSEARWSSMLNPANEAKKPSGRGAVVSAAETNLAAGGRPGRVFALMGRAGFGLDQAKPGATPKTYARAFGHAPSGLRPLPVVYTPSSLCRWRRGAFRRRARLAVRCASGGCSGRVPRRLFRVAPSTSAQRPEPSHPRRCSHHA